MWDSASGLPLLALRGHELAVTGVCFSPCGLRLASGSMDGTVRVWDAERGLELGHLRGHERGVQGVCFSLDGRSLASRSLDLTARVWDVASGRQRLCLRGHTGWLEDLRFSPDGELLATASSDQVRVWDAAEGREICCLRGHEGVVLHVRFTTADGSRLVSTGADGVTFGWELRSGTCQGRLSTEEAASGETGSGPAPMCRVISSATGTTILGPARRPIASMPQSAEHLTTHPSGHAWAGVAGEGLCLFVLEGREWEAE